MFNLAEIFSRPIDAPLNVSDAERILDTKELEEPSPDGANVRGTMIVEYVTKEMVPKQIKRAYFRCRKGQERIWGPPSKDGLCDRCRSRMLLWNIILGIAAASVIGYLVYQLISYIVAGVIVWAIVKYGNEKKQEQTS